MSVLDHAHVPVHLKEDNGKTLYHPGKTEKAYMTKKLVGGSESGQLTTIGQQQAYDFGLILRKKYGSSFISSNFVPEDI